MSFNQKYLDPRWQKRRLEIMQIDGFCCISCKSSTETLNVHHRYYVAKRDPWNYPDWALVTLCNKCHEGLHEMYEQDLQQWEHAVDFIDDRMEGLEKLWSICTNDL